MRRGARACRALGGGAHRDGVGGGARDGRWDSRDARASRAWTRDRASSALAVGFARGGARGIASGGWAFGGTRRRARGFGGFGGFGFSLGARASNGDDGVDAASTSVCDDDGASPRDAAMMKEERVGHGGNWGESSGRSGKTPAAFESIDGEVFRPRERLKTNADFDRVKRFGRTFNGSHLRIKAVDNASYDAATCTRLGIVVPKKRVRRAVDRNLIKRRIRHVFRTNKDKWPPRVDIIVFAGDTALEGGFEGLRDDMFAWASDYVVRVEQSKRGAQFKQEKKRRAAKFNNTPEPTPTNP